MGSFIYFINAVSNKQRINSRNRYQAASIIIENLNLQKKFHTVSHYYLYCTKSLTRRLAPVHETTTFSKKIAVFVYLLYC